MISHSLHQFHENDLFTSAAAMSYFGLMTLFPALLLLLALSNRIAAGNRLPTSGTVLFSLADRDKPTGVRAARRFAELGFAIVATSGTAAALEREGLVVQSVVSKLGEQLGMDAVDLVASGKVDLVVNTPRGSGPRADGFHIRRAAMTHHVACVTTVAAALAAANGIADWASHEPSVRSLQDYHRDGQLRLGL